MSNRGQEFGTPFSVMFAGTVSAVATQAASVDKKHFITDISVSSDKQDQTIQVRDGSTVIWQVYMAGSSNAVYDRSFSTPLNGSVGAAVSLYVGSATAVSYANISGYTL